MTSEAAGANAVDPRATYTRHRAEAAADAARRLRQERRLSHLRLATFVLAALIGWLAFGSRQIGPVWILPPA